jgi:hypothetical protein
MKISYLGTFKMFMPDRQNVDGSWRRMHGRRHFCFSQEAAIVSESIFHLVIRQRGSRPGTAGLNKGEILLRDRSEETERAPYKRSMT